MENIAAHWVHPCSRDEVGEVNETTRDVGLFVFLLWYPPAALFAHPHPLSNSVVPMVRTLLDSLLCNNIVRFPSEL